MVERRFNQAVVAVLEDGLSVMDAAAKVGVSRQALHGWLRQYVAGGLQELADRSHRPHGWPHRMDRGLIGVGERFRRQYAGLARGRAPKAPSSANELPDRAARN